MEISIYEEKEIKINKQWFDSLTALLKKYQSDPNDLNLLLLLGYISSAEFISKNMGQVKLTYNK